MKQIFSYIVAAMILSVSSIAFVGALLACDVFRWADPVIAVVLVLLFVLYFICFLLVDRYCSDPRHAPRCGAWREHVKE